jgi:hypothetical protein
MQQCKGKLKLARYLVLRYVNSSTLLIVSEILPCSQHTVTCVEVNAIKSPAGGENCSNLSCVDFGSPSSRPS